MTQEESVLYRLDTRRVLEIIEGQELKRWWVAEFAGVHKTTLRRWLSGRISRLKFGNVARLAAVLSTRPEVIAVPVG